MCLISQAYDYFYKRDYNNAITLFKTPHERHIQRVQIS